LQTKQRGWTNERIIACFSGWWHGKRVALFGFSTASALTRGFSAANFVRQYRANEGLQLLRSGDILIYAVLCSRECAWRHCSMLGWLENSPLILCSDNSSSHCLLRPSFSRVRNLPFEKTSFVFSFFGLVRKF